MIIGCFWGEEGSIVSVCAVCFVGREVFVLLCALWKSEWLFELFYTLDFSVYRSSGRFCDACHSIFIFCLFVKFVCSMTV